MHLAIQELFFLIATTALCIGLINVIVYLTNKEWFPKVLKISKYLLIAILLFVIIIFIYNYNFLTNTITPELIKPNNS